MRLTTVIAKLEPGGAQLGIARKAIALRRHGIETHVLAGEATSAGIELFRPHGIHVEVWGRGQELQYACRADFAEWLAPRLARAELVHAHMFGAWWAASRMIPPHVPLAASEHNALRWPGTPRRAEMRQALRRVDLFYAHGPAAREAVLEAGADRSRVHLGLSPVPFCGALRPSGSFASRRVVFAGRLHYEKGADLLLEALALMRDPPPAYILGEGPQREALLRLAEDLGLERRVTFTGWQPHPERWLAGAGACVIPSRHEAWSQTALLAMGLRVPVVGTAVEGMPVLLGRRRGVLVMPDHPAGLAEGIEAVLAGDALIDVDAGVAFAVAHAPERVARAYASDYAGLLTPRATHRVAA